MRSLARLLLLLAVLLPGAATGDEVDRRLALADLEPGEIYRKPDGESWGEIFARSFGRHAFKKSYALVIGVSRYEGDWPQLDATRDDPARMRRLLADQEGFDLIVTLTNERATKDRIAVLMRDVFPALLGPDDRFLFYFSGHGTQREIQGVGLVGYLPLTTSERVYGRMISMSELREWDRELSPVKQVLFLLDSCFSGIAGVQPMSGDSNREVALLADYGHHLITAGTKDEETIAGAAWGGSIFTDSLIRGAQGSADQGWEDGGRTVPRDGVVSLFELRDFVRKRVAAEAPEEGWRKPIRSQLYSLSDRNKGEFFFLTREKKVEGGQEARLDQGRPVATLGGQAAGTFDPREVAFWNSIEDSRDAADFEDYLDRFGDQGTFASLARRRLAALAPAGQPDATAPSAVIPLSPAEGEDSLGLSREDWIEVQEALTALGFDTQGADGRPGRNTRAALLAWQRARGAAVTGYLTGPQRDQIRTEAAQSQLAVVVPPPPPEPPSSVEPAVGVYGDADHRPGDVFRDCPECPEMVVVPAGEFLMGSPEGEAGRYPDEGPQHRVRIAEPFAIGRHEVTFAQWDACVADGGCGGYRPGDESWGRGRRPVINVSWEDAQAYVRWLSERTGARYRLPSEAEWEYAARAGTSTPFWTGATISTVQANYDGNYVYGSNLKGEYRERTVEVGSLPANPWGLHEVHGNVWEWVQDCWHDGYAGSPGDGRAWEEGCSGSRRVVRGGSWFSNPEFARSAIRVRNEPDLRNILLGFRVSRTLTP